MMLFLGPTFPLLPQVGSNGPQEYRSTYQKIYTHFNNSTLSCNGLDPLPRRHTHKQLTNYPNSSPSRFRAHFTVLFLSLTLSVSHAARCKRGVNVELSSRTMNKNKWIITPQYKVTVLDVPSEQVPNILETC